MGCLIICVIIILLSVNGINSQGIKLKGKTCAEEGAKFPSEKSCEFFYLCTVNFVGLQQCPNGQSFNIDLMECSRTRKCSPRIKSGPTVPINIPTAPVARS